MKTCATCHQSDKLFYSTGSYCKDCSKARATDWRKNNPDKTRLTRRKDKANRRGTEQHKARQSVWNAVYDGRMVKPTECNNCGATDTLHAHHHLGYAKENRRNVVWLCPSCHLTIHK